MEVLLTYISDTLNNLCDWGFGRILVRPNIKHEEFVLETVSFKFTHFLYYVVYNKSYFLYAGHTWIDTRLTRGGWISKCSRSHGFGNPEGCKVCDGPGFIGECALDMGLNIETKRILANIYAREKFDLVTYQKWYAWCKQQTEFGNYRSYW